MAIQIHALEKHLKVRKTEKKFESKPIGTMLKYQRQLLNMTLEETADDICSVSYLSKLENNLVSLSDRFANALFKRLQINEDDYHQSQNVISDYQKIITQLLLEQELDTSCMDCYRFCLDHQSQLMKLVLYGQQRNHDMFHKTYDDLLPFIVQFSHLELSLFMYSVAEYLFSEGHYDQSYEVLQSWDYQQSSSSQIILLLKKIHLRCALKLNKTNDIKLMYEDIFMLLAKRQLFKHLSDIQYDHIRYQCYTDSIETLQAKLSNMHGLREYEKNYVLALVMISKKMYREALDIITLYTNKKDEHWMMIHILTLELEGINQEEVLNLYEHFNPKSQDGLRLKKHIEMKHYKNMNEFLEYIKRDLLGPKATVNDFMIFRQLMLSSHHHLLTHHYYKDANKILERLDDMYM